MKRPVASLRQPLYLGRQVEVKLDDGPSLVVHAPGCVTGRFPLARLSQVVARSGCGLSGEVILACLEHRIPLIWQRQDGEAMAVAWPCRRQHYSWEERIFTACAHPQWQSRYAAWLAAQRNIALRALSRDRVLVVNGGVECWLDALLHREGIKRTLGYLLMREWETMSLALLVEYWEQLQLPAGPMLAIRGEGRSLACDIACCVSLRMTNQFVRGRRWLLELCPSNADAVHLAAAHRFSRRRERIFHLAAEVHARFARWLLEVESWQ